VASVVKSTYGAMVIGWRDPVTGKEFLNPENEHEVLRSMQLVYIADEPVLG